MRPAEVPLVVTPSRTYTPTSSPLLPTATIANTLTAVPLPTDTSTPLPAPPTRTIVPASPTPTPSVTPTLYPDAWVAGLLWDEARTILYVGSSSGVIYDARISYEPLHETVAEEIARYPLGTLVVFYGDYTPRGTFDGHMVVARVEQVNLPYDPDTPLTAMYTHPDELFAFAYPQGWTLTVEGGGYSLTLLNRPPDSQQYMGPGIAYFDPTTKYLSVEVRTTSLDDYVSGRQEAVQEGEDVSFEDRLKVEVRQREIDGLQVTQIEEESPLWGVTHRYVVPLNEEMVLVFTSGVGDIAFTERVLATLSLP